MDVLNVSKLRQIYVRFMMSARMACLIGFEWLWCVLFDFRIRLVNGEKYGICEGYAIFVAIMGYVVSILVFTVCRLMIKA